MSWSYSGDPQTSPLDETRFIIGDVDESNPVLTDEEIKFALSIQGSTTGAAIKCCESIIARMSSDVDYKIGPENVSASQRANNYRKLLTVLRKAHATRNAIPLADVSTDRVFDVGMFDCREL